MPYFMNILELTGDDSRLFGREEHDSLCAKAYFDDTNIENVNNPDVNNDTQITARSRRSRRRMRRLFPLSFA